MVVVAPGLGDEIQATKAGILEIGDIFVVNKADRDGADTAARELRHMLTLGERREAGEWRPPVVLTVASRGEGIDELVEALDKHASWLAGLGNPRGPADAAAPAPRSRPSRSTCTATASRDGTAGGPDLDTLADQVLAGTLDPYAAADPRHR